MIQFRVCFNFLHKVNMKNRCFDLAASLTEPNSCSSETKKYIYLLTNSKCFILDQHKKLQSFLQALSVNEFHQLKLLTVTTWDTGCSAGRKMGKRTNWNKTYALITLSIQFLFWKLYCESLCLNTRYCDIINPSVFELK